MRETKKEKKSLTLPVTTLSGIDATKRKKKPKSRDAIFWQLRYIQCSYLTLHHFACRAGGTLQGKEGKKWPGSREEEKKEKKADGTNAGTTLPFWDGACFSQVCHPARLAWPCTPGFPMCATTGSTCCWFRLYLVLSEQVSVGRPLKQPVPVMGQPPSPRGRGSLLKLSALQSHSQVLQRSCHFLYHEP